MKKNKIIVFAKAELTSTGFSAYCYSISVVTTGKDKEALTTNLIEAIKYYYEEIGCLEGHLISVVIDWP